jgi:hypothetical protein
MSDVLRIKYKAVPTGKKFHRSTAFMRGIMGPVRSGKSTLCSNEGFRLSKNQPPGEDGIRHSRGLVIRATYRELEDTTLKTWLDWWPEQHFGRFNHNEMTHHMRYDDVEADILFRAIESPADVRKLLSLEVSWAWVNEARELPLMVIMTAADRVGQYPAKKDGGFWFPCLMMDTNPPDDDHWWYKKAEGIESEEGQPPAGWRFFKQPGALIEVNGQFVPNPAAENIEHLNEGIDYYLKRAPGRPLAYVRVYYCGQYGFVVEGKPVHPDYVDAVHCAAEPIPFNKRYVLYLGLDFGLTPAAAFGQRYPNGRWVGIDEVVTEDMGAEKFAKELTRVLCAEPYNGAQEIKIFGDPAGDDRVQTDERTVYQILAANGIAATPCHTNDTTIRREALGRLLRGMVDGKPAFLLSPKCKIIRKGLAGGFCYKRIHVAGSERYADTPDKNRFSHPVEGLEYMLVGAGEGHSLVTPANPPELPTQASVAYDDGF